MPTSTYPRLISKVDDRVHYVSGRVITFGSSPGCTVQLKGRGMPDRICHILFTAGAYTIQALDRKCPVAVDQSAVDRPRALAHGNRISVGSEEFLWLEYPETQTRKTLESGPNAEMSGLIRVITNLLRNRDQDVFTDLVGSVSRLLRSDAARIMGEEPETGGQWTIARFPAGAELGRFSTRAIAWARSASHTVIMHDEDWRQNEESMASLERNRVASVLCAPLHAGGQTVGYLYLDRLREQDAFTEDDRVFCDALAPLFAEIIANSDERRRQRETIARLQDQSQNDRHGIIHESKSMVELIAKARTFAGTDSPVLILGETGTGKELTARLIHEQSQRSEMPFRPVNCGAIPENLIESELFGHEKGAFTGANKQKIGLLEGADGGTVFLDEVGELPLMLQVKLLRTLQEGEITRVGGSESINIDIRVVAATNRNLSDEVREGRFRQDLYFRLNVLSLRLPPLRDRGSDLLLLAESFVQRYCSRFGLNNKTLTAGARSALLRHTWPGNIRELENVIQKAVLLSAGDRIDTHDITVEETGAAPLPFDSAPVTLKDARSRAEEEVIRRTLEKVEGNVSLASKILEIDRKWLMKKMEELSIQADEYRSRASKPD